MLLAIALAVASVMGILFGIRNKKKPLTILSAIVLIMIISAWIYFYNNPY